MALSLVPYTNNPPRSILDLHFSKACGALADRYTSTVHHCVSVQNISFHRITTMQTYGCTTETKVKNRHLVHWQNPLLQRNQLNTGAGRWGTASGASPEASQAAQRSDSRSHGGSRSAAAAEDALLCPPGRAKVGAPWCEAPCSCARGERAGTRSPPARPALSPLPFPRAAGHGQGWPSRARYHHRPPLRGLQRIPESPRSRAPAGDSGRGHTGGTAPERLPLPGSGTAARSGSHWPVLVTPSRPLGAARAAIGCGRCQSARASSAGARAALPRGARSAGWCGCGRSRDAPRLRERGAERRQQPGWPRAASAADGTLGNNTIKAHYFKQLLITPWGFSPIPLDTAFKMFFGLLMIKDLDFTLYTKYFYGVYLSADLCMEITENSKKWKPLPVKEEKLSIIRVNSSYLRSMNDYRVTFLYRTFKFH
ncbi:uncharacterized protein LOC141730413 [Zonotrichia albicollis]|uniref:uncharacterized protein LOC141730413 n=1 Tax=Zonotrichia albicollis TaxID=44394 RepID=UPI003D80CB57